MCRALIRPGVEAIKRGAFNSLLAARPKQIKEALVGDYQLPDWRRDVWILTENDRDSNIEGNPSDVFVFKLTERTGSGYIWNFEELGRSGFAIVRDAREGPGDDAVGGHVTRSILGRPISATHGRILLKERRPWAVDGPSIGSLCVNFALDGAETEGLSQAERRLLAAAA